jgi:hypothetical protein
MEPSPFDTLVSFAIRFSIRTVLTIITGQTNRCPLAWLCEDFGSQSPRTKKTAANTGGKRFRTLAQLFQDFEGLTSEAALSSWKVFVCPKLVFDAQNYKEIDAAKRMVIVLCGAQTAGCLNIEVGGKFADFDLDDDIHSLLKESPMPVSPQCLGEPSPSKMNGLQGLVHSIQEFSESQPERTYYQQITQDLAKSMVVQGSHAAEFMDTTICAVLGEEPSKSGFKSGETFITGD